MAKKKFCVVTGSRAEYGLLYWLMRGIADDPAMELQLIVTGMHLEERFGNTVQMIEQDGFSISARVPMNIYDDSRATIAKSLGRGIIGMVEAMEELNPDCMILIGDRYEMLAAGQAGMALSIPLAHIHGGEATEGAIDEAIRHALTKMSQLHFVAAEDYRRRVIQMGEHPSRVFNVGAACLDNIDKLELLNRSELAKELDFDICDSPFFLVTYHPVTLQSKDQAMPVEAMLGAIDGFKKNKVIITGVNSDRGNEAITAAVREYSESRCQDVIYGNSLGQLCYLSAMKHAALVIGNSSSGIIEAPALNVPTVNIGERQKGRIRAASVVDCTEDQAAIEAAIEKAIDPEFLRGAETMDYPFGTPGAANRIKQTLADTDLDGILIKRFHDLPMDTQHWN